MWKECCGANSNGKAYFNQNFSGPNENLIRLNSEITYINLTNVAFWKTIMEKEYTAHY